MLSRSTDGDFPRQFHPDLEAVAKGTLREHHVNIFSYVINNLDWSKLLGAALSFRFE